VRAAAAGERDQRDHQERRGAGASIDQVAPRHQRYRSLRRGLPAVGQLDALAGPRARRGRRDQGGAERHLAGGLLAAHLVERRQRHAGAGPAAAHLRLDHLADLRALLAEQLDHRGAEALLTGRRHLLREVAIEIAAQRIGAGVAIVGVERHRPGADLLQQVRRLARRQRDVAGRHPAQDLGLAAAGPDRGAAQHLPQHDAGRVEVGAAIDGDPGDLLGRHVARLALEHADPGLVERVEHLGDAEVDELDLTVVGDEHVARRDVAMHDAERRVVVIGELVRVVQAGERLGQHLDLHAERKQLAGAARAPDALEGLALEVFHRDVVAALVLADVVGLDDVGVVEPRGQARFLEEHPTEVLVLGEVAAQQLDRDELLESAEPALRQRQVDLGHSSMPDLGDEPELSRELARAPNACDRDGGPSALKCGDP
jgi:hypothetical protein